MLISTCCGLNRCSYPTGGVAAAHVTLLPLAEPDDEPMRPSSMTMRRLGAVVALTLVATGCSTVGGGSGDIGECPDALSQSMAALSCADPRAGMDIQAGTPVMLTRQPLGDVVVGRLSAGDIVRATCIETVAQTNAGFRGSAVKVTLDDVSGFAATSTFPTKGGGRQAIFDMSTEQLTSRLDPC